MSKVVLRKDGMYIEADKITLGGPVTITGEFHLDEDNHIINESDKRSWNEKCLFINNNSSRW